MTNKQVIIREDGYNKNVRYNYKPTRFEKEEDIIQEITTKNNSKGLFGKLFNRSKIKVINLTIKGDNNTTYFKF